MRILPWSKSCLTPLVHFYSFPMNVFLFKLLAPQSSALRRGAYRDFHTHPIHPYPSSLKPVYTNAFRRCDYKFKIGAIRILLSENTFAGHWETVVDCMKISEKCQQ